LSGDGSCKVGSISIDLPETTRVGSIAWGEPLGLRIPLTGRIDLPVSGRTTGEHNVKSEELHFERVYDLRKVRIDEKPLAAMFGDWKSGSFEESFPDLAAAVSKNYLDFIDLRQVPERIREAQTRNEQNIEVFGLRIGADQVKGWGAALLIAVQLYFWLHLHELTARIAPAAPGWDVAWIGVYRSWSAFSALVASSCILPVVAAVVVAVRNQFFLGGALRSSPWHWMFAGTIIVASSSLSVATALRIHRLRISNATKPAA
jgi:hypothetical protein